MTAMTSPEPLARPLHPEDPPRLGGFWLDARLDAQTAGVVYRAHADAPAETGRADTGEDPATGRQVVLVLLSQGAATDRVARDRFNGEIDPLHVDLVVARGGQGQDTGRLARHYRESGAPVETGVPEAPWVALTADQAPLASTILERVGLELLGPIGRPAGPDYQLPWADEKAPGRTSQWPMPWPGHHDRAGWVSLFVSWLLMVLVTAIAVLVAILLFRNEAPQSPPPPQPSSASASPQSGSPSPQSESPSPSPSPSPQSASPSPESASASPSPQPASPSPGASPTEDGTGNPERSKL